MMIFLLGCTSVRPGQGIVESVYRTPGDSTHAAAAHGGTYPAGYLIRVRMEDGSIQAVTQLARDGIGAGDRVEVTPEGRVSKVTSR
jgi:hypothetical protein